MELKYIVGDIEFKDDVANIINKKFEIITTKEYQQNIEDLLDNNGYDWINLTEFKGIIM